MDAQREPLMTPALVAEQLGVSVKLLAHWRYLGTGPLYLKPCGVIRYRWSDVAAWLDARTRSATR